MNDDIRLICEGPVPARSVSGSTSRIPAALHAKGRWIATAAVISVGTGCSSSPSTETFAAPGASMTDASPSATVDVPTTGDASAADPSADDGASEARFPPSQGGASGTVGIVATLSFLLTTGAGQQVTINEAPSTTYDDETGAISASAVLRGENALVLGVVKGMAITAMQVVLLPGNATEAVASADAGVLPFREGTPSPSKQVGKIPASYAEGEGTIVNGRVADQVTESALLTFPGVVIDRVVQLTGGDGGDGGDSGIDYEAHCIGVAWPQHIFVDQDFNFLGAD